MITLSDKDINIVNNIFEEKEDEKFEVEKVENPVNNYYNRQFPGMKKLLLVEKTEFLWIYIMVTILENKIF